MTPPRGAVALVCFRVAETRYAVRVEDAAGVLPRGPFEPLPDPQPDVVGLLRTAAGPLPVLAPWPTAGGHVLVLDGFGLLVDEVTAVVRVSDDELHPPPGGQARPVVRAVAKGAGRGALVLDTGILGERVGLAPTERSSP